MANANANMVNRTSNTNNNTSNNTNKSTNTSNNTSNTNNTNNKWLLDRIHGQSKYNDNERPPNPCCWVSPIVGYFPVLLETNGCCRWFGKIGVGSDNNTNNNTTTTTTPNKNELVRFYLLHFGFLCNILAVVLTAYAALSISLEYFLLCKSSLFEITILETTVFAANSASSSSTSNTIYFGFSGIGIENQQSVIGYNTLCSENGNENDNENDPYLYLLNSGQSSDCNNYNYFSMNSSISILISLSLFVPTFFLTQLRMYSGYDSNCVKNTLTILGLVIVLLNLNIILSSLYLLYFNNTSFIMNNNQDNNNKNEAYYMHYDQEGNIVGDNSDDISYSMEVSSDWNWSWGLILLVTGTGLKFLDLVCNILVSTPTITRNKKEQEIYETI
jgi:hypothetical protein